MGGLERAFFANFEDVTPGVLEGTVFPGDTNSSSGGGAAGGGSAEGSAGGVLDDGAVDGHGVPAGAIDDIVANEAVVSIDAHVPAHCGDPVGEWHALEEGHGFTVVGLDVVAVRGTDRRRWLHSLLNQVLADIAPGASAEVLLFSPSGYIENGVLVYDDGDIVWLLRDRGGDRRWADFLNSVIFTIRVEVNLREDLLAVGAFVPVGASRQAEAIESPSEGIGSRADGTVSSSAGTGPGAGGTDSPSESSSLGLDSANSGPKGIGLPSGGSAAAALKETALLMWRDP